MMPCYPYIRAAHFDLFHSGHVEFLRRCAEFGPVTVVINSDKFIEEYKGKPPVISEHDRLAVVLACKYVDDAFINDGGADSRNAIEYVNPDIIVIGSDWARKDYYKQMGFDQDWLDNREISLCYVPYSPWISSTQIKTRLLGVK